MTARRAARGFLSSFLLAWVLLGLGRAQEEDDFGMGDDMPPDGDMGDGEDEGYGDGEGEGYGGGEGEGYGDGEGEGYGGGEGDGEGGGGTGEGTMGAVKLDNMTLDKVVGLPGFATLVKFDAAYPYGEKQDEFGILCPLAHKVPGFFVGEVQVSDHGDKENDDLRERFGLAADDFPVYLLFRGPGDMIKYSGAVTAADIASWLRRKGVKMPAVGTIAEFDEIAARFATGESMDKDIEAAQKMLDGDFKDDPKAAMYVKIMKTCKQKGLAYIRTESARIEKILAGSLTEAKRGELSDKARLLGMFDVAAEGEL